MDAERQVLLSKLQRAGVDKAVLAKLTSASTADLRSWAKELEAELAKPKARR